MKAVYLFFISCLFAVNVYGQYADVPHNDDPVLPNKRLVAAQVKTEKAYGYHFGKKGIADSVLLWTKLYTYNTQNQLIRQETLNDGKTKVSSIYWYNKYSEIVKMAEVSGKRIKGRLDSTFYQFQYDTLGNTRFIYKYNRDTSNVYTTERIYNDKKQVISVLLKVGINDGDFFTIRNLTYNENGDLSALEYLDGNGNTTAEYAFTYDYPNKKRLVFLLTKDKRKFYEAYTYTINKDIARLEQFTDVDAKKISSAVPSQVTKYYYDGNGLMASEVTYTDGELTSFTKYFYEK
jgi:YD repeat-containing protein